MGLETGDYIDQLDPNNPTPNDPKSQGDDHIRLIKHVLQTQFPNLGEVPVTKTAEELNQPYAPTGAIYCFPTGAAVPGFINCDGQEVSRETYLNLFSVIGVIFGAGDGTTTFNVPDYRGMFLRMRDIGAGNDPDAASRTDRGDGTGGDEYGTRQADQYKQHRHGLGATVPPGGGGGYNVPATTSSGNFTANAGGNETRPKNVYVSYRIAI